MDRTKKLWLALGVVLVGTFTLLGVFGREVYRQAPPIPERVVTASGTEVMTKDQILRGQRVWQSMGGQQVGSIWGHGAYQAPDWSADWLHRESVALLALYANEQYDRPFDELSAEEQAGLKERLRREMRSNRYDAETGTLTVSDVRARAMARTAAHYDALFGGDASLAGLLALGLTLLVLRRLLPKGEWKDRPIRFAFWAMNGGLALMVLVSLLPIGLAQAAASIDQGLWYARSDTFLQQPIMETLRWLRMIGDTLFLAGVGALVWFVVGLKTGWSLVKTKEVLS